ncbi:MAG: PD-(D/E)XK nuclease family protein [Bacteroidia bacterium]|nr:PD-(D/E)XK nuclease family protein [Bacteroidia bacterium]MCX7764539.1 PD-(D/E)XK nuclease family protein [Bacteroidia bacterium]
MRRGLLAPALWEHLKNFIHEGWTIVVADPYLAQALKAHTGYERFSDIYSWAVDQIGRRKPNPIDLLTAYETALKETGLQVEESFAEMWEAAQRLGRDWEELLRGISSLEEVPAFWKNLAEHRLIDHVFKLFGSGETPAWLAALPFPQRHPTYASQFWQNFQNFIQAYENFLQRNRLIFSEKALHLLAQSNKSWGKVIFLHIYSVYPAIRGVLNQAHKKGAQVWGADLTALRQQLPEIWRETEELTQAFPFEIEKPQVHFHLLPTIVEVLEQTASLIADFIRKQPEAYVGVWCEGENARLLRFLLENRERVEVGIASPPLSLLEQTEVGKQLDSHFLGGIRRGADTWPSVELPEAAQSKPEEVWALQLYELVKKRTPPSKEAWQFLLKLLLSESPQSQTFSERTQIYIGRLAQLAGGRYDALFIVEPSDEPLGKWMRPSFWVASLRREFSPPADHHKMAWRLMSLLLWASREVHILRRTAPEYNSPLEELLRASPAFGIEIEPIVSSNGSPALPSVSGEQAVHPQTSLELPKKLSPTWLGQLLACPRRAYWSQTIKDTTPNQALLLGQLLHRLLSEALPPSSQTKYSLQRLARKLSRRRLYYRIAAWYRREKLWSPHNHLLRSSLAKAAQPFLRTLLEILTNASFPPKKIEKASYLRWKDLIPYSTCKLTLHPEIPIGTSTPPLSGRMDLLIKMEAAEPSTGELKELTILIDFKSSVQKDSAGIDKVLEAAIQGTNQLREGRRSYITPEGYREAPFQLATYMWMLSQQGQAVDYAVLVSLWWRPSKRTSADPKPPYEAYAAAEFLGENSEKISSILHSLRDFALQSQSPESFPMTQARQLCKYCDFSLLCDRLS